MDILPYENVVKFLEENDEISPESLARLLKTSPEGIDVFEQILQNSNFSTAQYTYLMFDLNRLNSPSVHESLGYILELLHEDDVIRQRFRKKGLPELEAYMDLEQVGDERKCTLLGESKKLIAKLCEKNDPTLLRHRVEISELVRKRIAEYFIQKRYLNKVLAGIRPRVFLENKRIPVDPKTAHGKYATRILEDTLVKGGFQCRDDFGRCIRRSEDRQSLLPGRPHMFFYGKERQVESIHFSGASISSESNDTARKTAKHFDFVLLYGNVPKILIEANFYTTGGTKIGINEKEYLAFHEQIAQKEKDLRFIWVTDGSYWLTTSGKRDFLKLAPLFRGDLMNLAMFAEKLPTIRKTIGTAAE